MRSVRSCICTGLHHDVKCVVIRHCPQKRALSAVVLDDGVKQSQVLEFGNWKAMNRWEGVEDDCDGDTLVKAALTWATAMLFMDIFRSSVLSQRFFDWLVVCNVSFCSPI